MHFFESWFSRPQLNLEVSKNNFNTLVPDEPTYSIHLYSDAEVVSSEEPFAYSSKLYGETRTSVLYTLSPDSKKMFLVFPTLSEPLRMDIDYSGKSHLSNHLGTLLAKSILALPIAKGLTPTFKISISEAVKQLVEGIEHEFLLGVLQRSISQKIKSNSNNNQFTLIFDEKDFSESSLKRAKTMSYYMSVTRSLINMPGNILDPETYADAVKFLVNDFNAQNKTEISFQVMEAEELENLGCGLISAVGKGSTVAPRIVKMTYSPENASRHVSLVGKGITFDSGGYNIKPSAYMRNMKKDMGGSAAVVGTFFAAAALNTPIRLTAYLALAENMVSGNAMRPGDIYTAHNGLKVEIDNTDAEGRLVLADALCLAVEDKPDWIIDLATLTGAARTALGTMIDSAFGNRKEYRELLDVMSQDTGDWIWHLPLPAPYNAYFDSRVADIVNSTVTPYAGTITAALFLQKFVGTCAWTHIDTFMWCDRSSGMWAEDNAPTAKCVRLLVNSLMALSK